MQETLTVSLSGGGLGEGRRDAGGVSALVLLWSRDEPERMGEVALLPTAFVGLVSTLGRAESSAADALTRIEFVRQRPGLVERTGPFRSPRVSRDQLRIHNRKGKALLVENVGRAVLFHNGQPTQTAEIELGDILELRGVALLLCAHRPLAIPSFATGTQPPRPFRYGGPDHWGIVGESPAVWNLRERVSFLGARTAHVLIRGASGTGKELVAQAIHARSARASHVLVSRNAATIPDSLIDAELFGNARNYPNPGMAERPGLIGEADKGTLFLDEFAELPSAMQAHLLRVLDQGEYTRLGESRNRKADLRLIAATNRPESALKEDVLARLRIRVEIPDLNSRREDIPLLAVHLMRRIGRDDPDLAKRYFPDGDITAPPRIAMPLIEGLVRHNYTTNVRELELLLWTAMTEGRGDTVVAWDGFPKRPGAPEADVATQHKNVASQHQFNTEVDPLTIPPELIQATLDKYNGRQEPVWRELGLSSRHVLTRLVKRYNLNVRGRSGGDFVHPAAENDG